MIAFLHTRTLQGVLLLLAAAAVAGPARRSEAQSSPHFWRQREFFIPYQPNLSDPRAGKAVRVQLLLSRDDGVRWAVLQEAEPHVRGFSYLAPEDGSYAFAVRAVDRKGGYWPETVAQPALRIFVDTQPPTLELAASIDAVGQVVVRYEARDQRLNPETLRLEMQGDGGLWEPLSVGTPELSQPDRLLGRTQWRPPVSLREVRVRGTVADAAGNSISAATSASLTAGLIDPGSGPQLGPPGGDAAVDWHASAPSSPFRTEEPARAAVDPPGSAPWGRPAADGPVDPFASLRDRGAETRFASTGAAPSLLTADSPAAATWGDDPWRTAAAPRVDSAAALPPAADPGGTRPAGVLWVNSPTFDVDYDIPSAGPWGVAKVELWGTRDEGRTWNSLGVDQDNRSPMRVTVPGEGVYGFRIVVDGANGVTGPRPQGGEAPELVVGVDLTVPRTELRSVEPGAGALAGHLVIRWAAQDDRLTARPVSLFYSPNADGPWTTIATDVENGGEYVWRVTRDAPPKLFLRLEVRDAASNVAVAQTPTAIDLDLPRPAGRLRSVRPAPAEPGKFRTAAGPRQSER